MPIYYFVCRRCRTNVRRVMEPAEAARYACPACGRKMTRQPKPPATQVNETVDNGIMPRAIERLANAEELSRERAAAHKSGAMRMAPP